MNNNFLSRIIFGQKKFGPKIMRQKNMGKQTLCQKVVVRKNFPLKCWSKEIVDPKIFQV